MPTEAAAAAWATISASAALACLLFGDNPVDTKFRVIRSAAVSIGCDVVDCTLVTELSVVDDWEYARDDPPSPPPAREKACSCEDDGIDMENCCCCCV